MLGLFAALLLNSSAAMGQSWNLVWREDFGVAEDTVIKDFPNESMTVPRHSFAGYKSEPFYGSAGYIEYHQKGEWIGECGVIDDGQYGIANSTWWAYNRFASCKESAGHFVGGRDHTGNKNGAMLIVNSEVGTGLPIFTQKIEFDLCDSRQYRFVIYASSITAYQDDGGNANLELKVINSKTGVEIENIKTGDIPFWSFGGWGTKNPSDCSTCDRDWTEYSCEFTANDGDVLELQVVNWGAGYNDFVIDDISLYRKDTEEVPVPEISSTSIAQSSGSADDCSFMASFSVPQSIIADWHKIYDNVYFLWQQSTDDGLTWTNVLDVSGIDQTDVEIEMDKSKNTIFRLITTGGSSETLAKEQALYIAANGGPKDGCSFYSISNTLSAKPAADCSYSDDLKALFVDDFGSVPDKGATNSAFAQMAFLEKGLAAGNYAVTANPQNTMKNSWDGIPEFADHTGNADGGMIFCKLNKDVTTIYERQVPGPFCKCKSFIFSFYATALGGWSTLNMEAVVEDNSGNVLASLPISKGNNGKDASWQQYLLDFSPADGTTSVVVKLVSTDKGTESYGTNVVIDDISLRICGMHIPQDSIYIDNDVSLCSLSKFDCTEVPGHTINLSSMAGWSASYPDAAVVWQTSADGGLTWKTIPATGKSVAFESEDGGEVSYRAIIGEDAATAKAVAEGKSDDGCGVSLITNTVTLSCEMQCHFNDEMLVLWKDDFGSVPAGTRKGCDNLQGHKLLTRMSESVNDGYYAVVSRMKDAGTWFAAMDGTDHTGNADGGFLLINVDPDYKGKVIYEQELGFTTCNETSYFFSLWAASISKRVANGDADGVLCNLKLEILDASTQDVLASIETGEIPNAMSLSGNIPWKNYGTSFVSKGEKVILRIYDNAGSGKKGNDLVIDDISLIACDEAAPKVELAVDGKDDVTGVCNETEYLLSIGDIKGWNDIYGDDVYCLWQKSADGGETWETITDNSGSATDYGTLNVTALRNMQKVEDSLVNVGYRYRVIVAGPKSEVTEQIAKQGYPNDGCYLYRISNVLTVRCECNEPIFDQVNAKFDICQSEDPIVLKVQQVNAVTVDSVCWYSKMPTDKAWQLERKLEGSDIDAEALHYKFVPTDSVQFLFLAYNETCESDSLFFAVNVDKPIVLEDLVSTTLCEGSDTTYSAVVTSGYPLSYVWNGKEGTATDLALANLSADQDVVLVAKGAVCESEPVSATVTVEKMVTISDIVGETDYCGYKETTLDSKAKATHIQWYRTFSGGSVFNAISGATEAVYAFTTDSSRTYKVVASGDKCPSKEKTIDLNVTYPAKVEAMVDKTGICLGETAKITVTLDNVPALDWMSSTDGLSYTKMKSTTHTSTETSTEMDVSPTTTTYYYVVIPSDGDCAAGQSEVMILEVEQPLDFSLEADKDVICLGEEVTLTTDVRSGVTDVVVGNVSPEFDGGSIKIQPTETTTYEITGVGALCKTPVVRSVKVEVEIPTSFSELLAPEKICQNEQLALTYEVTPENAPFLRMVSADGVNFTSVTEFNIPSATTFYKLQSTAGKACQASETNVVKVEVEDSVRFTFEVDKTAICAGSEVVFTTQRTSGDFSSMVFGDGTDKQVNADASFNLTPVKTATYTLTAKGDVCPEVTKSVEVEVQTPATLSIAADVESICVNTPVNITLTADNASSTAWQSSADGVSFTPLATDGKGLLPQTDTWYKVSALGSEACPGSESNILKIHVEDSVRFSIVAPESEICSGTAVDAKIILESGNGQMGWYLNGALVSEGEMLHTVPLAANNEYIAEVKGGICPTVSKTYGVDVEMAPEISSFEASATAVCANTEVQLDLLQTNALGLVWEKRLQNGAFETMSNALDASVTDTPTSTTIYRVRTVGAKICKDVVSPEIKVSVEDSVAVALGDDVFVCPGVAAQLDANVKGRPTKVEWTANGEPMASSSLTPTVKPTETTVYTVIAKANQCPDAVAKMTVQVEDIPELTITASADSLCEGEEVTLAANFVNDTSIQWMSRYANASLFEEMEKGTASLTTAPELSVEYRATAYTEHGCAVKSEPVSVNVSAKIAVAVTDTVACEGISVNIPVTGKSSYQYAWYADAAYTELISVDVKCKMLPEESADYYLKVTNGRCEEKLSAAVTVISNPKIVAITDAGVRELHFDATGGAGAYEYDFGKGWTSDNIFSGFYFGTTYSVKVRDEAGCLGDTTFTTSTYDIKVPEYFSPNGDGVNDLFVVENLDKYPDSKIRIYDRYAKLLVETTSDAFIGWDGTYMGHQMPSTDYWYEIWVEELAKYFTGHFTLLRGE